MGTPAFLTASGKLQSIPVLRHSGILLPAWLLCLVSGLLLTVAAHLLLVRIHVILALPVLTYPSLTALLTCALWLTFFR